MEHIPVLYPISANAANVPSRVIVRGWWVVVRGWVGQEEWGENY